jgi:hypothetical protein
MNGVSASDSFFNDVRSDAPANAVAALVRTNVGPIGDDYLGQDHLLLVNLTDAPLSNPTLGLGTPGSAFAVPLLVRGFARNPAFGGGGAATLSQLPAESVYATLVGQNEQLNVNVGVSGLEATEIPFETLDVFYLTPPPGDFNLDGLVNSTDIDALAAAAAANSTDPLYDLDGDGIATYAIGQPNSPNPSDSDVLIYDILETRYGDLNLDGTVFLSDLNTFATNYRRAGQFGWAEGNINGSQEAGTSANPRVFLADLNALATHWRFGVGSGFGGGATVPEPGSWLVALGEVLAILCSRSYRRRTQ